MELFFLLMLYLMIHTHVSGLKEALTTFGIASILAVILIAL